MRPSQSRKPRVTALRFLLHSPFISTPSLVSLIFDGAKPRDLRFHGPFLEAQNPARNEFVISICGFFPTPSTFLAQTRRAYRYRGVEVVSMTSRWVEAEFEAIFREHYGRIIRVTRRVLQRDSEAEEVCAEVFLRLYRTGPSVAAGGLVGAWLYRTATRASIDALRANRRRGAEIEDEGAMQSEDPTEGPLTLLLRRERIAEVRDVLAQLKVDKAQLLLLHHSGLTYQEIAQAMQMNVHSVGTKLARAEAEFSTLYQQHQRRDRKTQQLQTAKEGQ